MNGFVTWSMSNESTSSRIAYGNGRRIACKMKEVSKADAVQYEVRVWQRHAGHTVFASGNSSICTNTLCVVQAGIVRANWLKVGTGS